jgi:hypothetical protein
MMTAPTGIGKATAGIWNAPDRAVAITSAEEVFGADGSGMLTLSSDGPPMPAADVALFTDPVIMPILVNGMQESFTFGLRWEEHAQRAGGDRRQPHGQAGLRETTVPYLPVAHVDPGIDTVQEAKLASTPHAVHVGEAERGRGVIVHEPLLEREVQ